MQSNELNRRVAEALGWRVEQVKSGHWRMMPPPGGFVGKIMLYETADDAWEYAPYFVRLDAIMPLVMEAAWELDGTLTILPIGHECVYAHIFEPAQRNPSYTGKAADLPRALCLLWLDYAALSEGGEG